MGREKGSDRGRLLRKEMALGLREAEEAGTCRAKFWEGESRGERAQEPALLRAGCTWQSETPGLGTGQPEG